MTKQQLKKQFLLRKKNMRIGMKNAYYQATGKKATSVAHAARYFGVKAP